MVVSLQHRRLHGVHLGGDHKDMYVRRSWPSLTSFEHPWICGFGQPRSLRWSRAHSRVGVSVYTRSSAAVCACGTCLPSRSHSHILNITTLWRTRWERATHKRVPIPYRWAQGTAERAKGLSRVSAPDVVFVAAQHALAQTPDGR